MKNVPPTFAGVGWNIDALHQPPFTVIFFRPLFLHPRLAKTNTMPKKKGSLLNGQVNLKIYMYVPKIIAGPFFKIYINSSQKKNWISSTNHLDYFNRPPKRPPKPTTNRTFTMPWFCFSASSFLDRTSQRSRGGAVGAVWSRGAKEWFKGLWFLGTGSTRSSVGEKGCSNRAPQPNNHGKGKVAGENNNAGKGGVSRIQTMAVWTNTKQRTP